MGSFFFFFGNTCKSSLNTQPIQQILAAYHFAFFKIEHMGDYDVLTHLESTGVHWRRHK